MLSTQSNKEEMRSLTVSVVGANSTNWYLKIDLTSSAPEMRHSHGLTGGINTEGVTYDKWESAVPEARRECRAGGGNGRRATATGVKNGRQL